MYAYIFEKLIDRFLINIIAKEKEEITYNERKRMEAESQAKFKGGSVIYIKNYRDKDS